MLVTDLQLCVQTVPVMQLLLCVSLLGSFVLSQKQITGKMNIFPHQKTEHILCGLQFVTCKKKKKLLIWYHSIGSGTHTGSIDLW